MLNFWKASAFRSVLLLCAGLAVPAASFTLTLNCYIPGAGTTCTAVPVSYGSLTISDIAGGVEVNLVTALGGKFKDLLLNTTASPVLAGPADYNSNFFQLTPYSGMFDIDTDLASGGHNSNTPFSILGTAAGFDAASFITKDSANVLYAIVHLQQITCDANGQNCVFGGNSLKVGASLAPPSDPPSDDPVPEPATYAIVGLGLGAAHFLRKRG